MDELAGKVAIVTGAAQGLGLGIAHSLHAAGARVAMVDHNASGLAKAAAEVAASPVRGSDVATFVVDLRDAAATRAVPLAVEGHFGSLDILVNNAGVRTIASFQDQTIDDWSMSMDVNLTAPFILTQAALPFLLRKGGKIVNVTSVASSLGFKNRSAYNVSKAGLTMLTKSIALELAGSGINCNAVAPGVIETPLNASYFLDPDFTKVIVDNTPAGTWGKPADIGAAVVFLSGPNSDFINGITIPVDGGWSAGKGY